MKYKNSRGNINSGLISVLNDIDDLKIKGRLSKLINENIAPADKPKEDVKSIIKNLIHEKALFTLDKSELMALISNIENVLDSTDRTKEEIKYNKRGYYYKGEEAKPFVPPSYKPKEECEHVWIYGVFITESKRICVKCGYTPTPLKSKPEKKPIEKINWKGFLNHSPWLQADIIVGKINELIDFLNNLTGEKEL